MSSSLHAGSSTAVPATATTGADVRKLYVVRFAFAIVWAGLFAVSSSSLTPLCVALLLIYPLFDAGRRSSTRARPEPHDRDVRCTSTWR